MTYKVLLTPYVENQHRCELPYMQIAVTTLVETTEDVLGSLIQCECGKYWHVHEFMERSYWSIVTSAEARRFMRERKKLLKANAKTLKRLK